MSLIDEAKEKCVMLERVSVSDGRGSGGYTWTEGEEFDACIYLADSLETEIALAKGVKGIYEITIDKSIEIKFNDVFKRISDGRTFRVTSRSDNTTPDSSGLNLRVVRAEDYTAEF